MISIKQRRKIFKQVRLARDMAVAIKQTAGLVYSINAKAFVMIIVLNALWGLSDIPILLVGKEILDLIIDTIGDPNWERMLGLLVLLVAMQSGFEIGRSFLSRLSRAYDSQLTREVRMYVELMIKRKYAALDVAQVEQPKFKDKHDRVERENYRIWQLLSPLFMLPQNILGFLSNAGIILTFGPLYVIAIGLVKIPETVVQIWFINKNYQLDQKNDTKWRQLWWALLYLGGKANNYESRIFNTTNYLLRKAKQLQAAIIQPRFVFNFQRTYVETGTGLISQLFLMGFSIYLFVQALAQQITLGYAQMIYRASNGLQNYVGALIRNVTDIYENYLYIQDYLWLMALHSNRPQGTREANPNLPNTVEFKNVWFKYPSAKTWTLKNVSFQINAGENIALVGENGVGKTTLIKLLCGFYLPQKGKILVNGQPITEYTEESYLRLLSVLFQDFEQYQFSAKESIGFGDVRRILQQAEIEQAAKSTNIDDYLAGLPKGYATPLSKHFQDGVDPSKGQWQRIALARAVFKRAPILILDEPTSNVDPKAEEKIFNEVMAMNKDNIVLLISHRFSTVRQTDRILVLDNGKLVEQGTHDELMQYEGTYNQMFTAQAKGYR